jgi:hypothetical protein
VCKPPTRALSLLAQLKPPCGLATSILGSALAGEEQRAKLRAIAETGDHLRA